MNASKLVGLALGSLVTVSGCGLVTPHPAATTSPPWTADRCEGAFFDADSPDPSCLHLTPTAPAPRDDVLEAIVRGDARARAGLAGSMLVELRNTSDEAVSVDIDPECAFHAFVVSPDGRRTDDCVPGCKRGPQPRVLRVRLEPNGVILKRAQFYAEDIRGVERRTECSVHSFGPLSPGRYRARVPLWREPVRDTAVVRSLDTVVTVLP